MSTAVDDVHHRNGEHISVGAADVTVQGHIQSLGSSVCGSQRHAQDSVGTELALGGSAIEGKHLIVECALVEHIVTLECGSDYLVDIVNGLQDALATETALVTVAELECFVLTGAGARRNTCAAHNAVLKRNLNFHCRIATGIQNLTGMNLLNLHCLMSFIK